MSQDKGQLELPGVDRTANVQPDAKLKRIRYPLWTENKAKLIERYLFYFVQITKHGTYIDGFAGPQSEQEPELWAAKLVLENKPQWFRHFHLCDASPKQVEKLKRLKQEQPVIKGRSIHIYSGDFNEKIDEILSTPIRAREATFCLLDQRTFECHWTTVERLAQHKQEGNKIELFYFLAQGWLDRALAAQKDLSQLDCWWGDRGWQQFREVKSGDERVSLLVERFRSLGYAHVSPWPIYENRDSRRIMYYMIHATDHPEAPALMARAYDKAIEAKETPEQLRFLFDEHP